MRALILGGDGFIGWPLALRLSKKGHDVFIVDNFIRRDIDKELGVDSLTPIQSIDKRIRTWREITKLNIEFQNIDIANDFDGLNSLFSYFKF